MKASFEYDGAGGQAVPTMSRARVALVVVAVALGFVMAMLDVTVVNVALGDIQADFHAPLSALVWMIDAYTLTFAALLLLGGALADRLGAKRAYMLGLGWFVAASVLCGIANSTGMLIAARLAQGFGAAVFMPSSLSLLTETFPDRVLRTKLLGIWSAIVGIAAGSGPFVGGLMVSSFGWRSIFYLNLPIGLAGIVLSALVLAPSPRKGHPFDVSTHVLIMAALAGLSFALIEGPVLGWFSPGIAAGAALAVVCLIAILRREQRSAHPVVPRTLVGNRHFWAYNGMGFLVNFVIFGQIFVVSLFLERARGATALETGAAMLPMMGVLSIVNVISGQLSARHGLRWVIRRGLAMAVLGAVTTAILGGGQPFWLLVIPLTFGNAGIGLAVPAMITGVMHEAGASDANVAAAMLNANRQIGALAGVAIIGIFLHVVTDWTTSVSLSFAAFALCLAASLVLVSRVLGATVVTDAVPAIPHE